MLTAVGSGVFSLAGITVGLFGVLPIDIFDILFPLSPISALLPLTLMPSPLCLVPGMIVALYFNPVAPGNPERRR